MDKKELELLIENFPDKYVLRRYKTYVENKDKSFTEIRNKYVREVRNAIKNGYIEEDTKEIKISVDAYRKSIRNIEEKGVESIFIRKDIVNYAMFINPICANTKLNMHVIKEYIKRKFVLRLESGKNGNYKLAFGDRFGSEETFRKELLEHLAICKKKVVDINSLKDEDNIYFIDTYTRDNYHLHIKGYKYDIKYGVTSMFEDIYESKYLQSKQDKEQGEKSEGKIEMPEFSVSVTPYEREGSNIRGLARIYFEDSFIVNNINILQGNDKVFVAMPSYKTKQVDEQNKPVYQDVCYPVTKEFREKLFGEILDTYEKEKEKQQEQAQNKNQAKELSKDGFQRVNNQEGPFR